MVPVKSNVAQRSYNKGRIDGYNLGFHHGRRMGRCQKIMSEVPPYPSGSWDIKVMYVPEGLFNLHRGIVDHLSRYVREMVVADPYDDVSKLAAQERPDLVLVLNGVHGLQLNQIQAIRNMGITTAVWFADDPYFTDRTVEYAKHYDIVFTHELSCVPLYQANGCPSVHYLPLAVNPNVFKPMLADPQYRSDVCFIGTGFPNRIHFFNQITHYLKHLHVVIAGAGWNQLADYGAMKDSIILAGIQPELTPLYYNGAKIVINMHRGTDELNNSRRLPALSINPRTFEIAGCGAFQLTDVRSDLGQYYTPDEMATYSTPEQMLDHIRYYLSHDETRETMAMRALQRTLMHHTYPHRLSQILSTIYG